MNMENPQSDDPPSRRIIIAPGHLKRLRLDDPPSQSILIASMWMFGMSLIFYLSMHINRKIVHLVTPGTTIPWIVNIMLGLPVFVVMTYRARRDDPFQTKVHILGETGMIVVIEILMYQLISRGFFKVPNSPFTPLAHPVTP